MKKILLLVIPCLLLSGCTVNYNLKIEDNKFIETIKGNVLNEELKTDKEQTDINLYYELINFEQNSLISDETAKYKKTISQNKNLVDKNSIDYIFSYTYNKETINDSRILNECFENFTFEEKDNKYYFIAFGDFYCNYTKDININITTDYKVINHNANKIENNTYTWTINENNTENLELYITINKNQQSNALTSSWSILKITSFITLMLTSAICLFVIQKKKK